MSTNDATLSPASPLEAHHDQQNDSATDQTLQENTVIAETTDEESVSGDTLLGSATESSESAATEYDDDTNSFSDFSDDSSSFYSSLPSSATEYYWENGRRYHGHAGGRYVLPNDEVELDREDMKHHEWMIITDFRLHLSPIGPNPQRILDIGTGTGIWAIQAAEMYPSAEVIGTDISPIQPKWVPPNLQFEIDDLEAEWLYRPSTYDLINVRFMFLAIKDFPAMLAQAYRTLKPGGYVELSELDLYPASPDSSAPKPIIIYQWLNLLEQSLARRGFQMHVARQFKGMLEDAGFVDIVEERFEVPWGPWKSDKKGKAVGFWHIEQLKQGLQGIVMALLTRSLGWTASDVEIFLVDLRKELDDMKFKLLDHAYVVYGRKPLT